MATKATRWAAFVIGLCLVSPQVQAVELKQETVAVFERYVLLTEARMQSEMESGTPEGAFLWMDGLPAGRRDAIYGQLRQGGVVVERLKTLDGGKEIEVPDGIIHHWVGVVFIPGGTLKETLARVKDYDRHASIYKPEVLQSKLLAHAGNDYKIYLRLMKKKVITVVMNTEHDVRYFPVNGTREYSRSYTTRIAQVEHPGESTEKEKPVGNDGGFLWRLYSYWRFEEKDGGVYVQCEAVSLTRSIPVLVSWLVKPFVTSIPRESLVNTLTSTRTALTLPPVNAP